MATNSCRLMIGLFIAASLSGCLEGKDGKDGINGIDGANGANATPVLLKTSPESVGANCPGGGVRIDSGLDTNLNGNLDIMEIQTTSYVCDGASGSDGRASLIKTTPEPAGANCPAGGHKIETGADANGNNVLDAIEIQATSYICNGEDGTNGMLSLVLVQSEPAGVNCNHGGQRIDSGLDVNSNGVLDAAERSTAYVCNGSNGSDGSNGSMALVSLISEPAGENCEAGGYRLDSGLDMNDNSVLDVIEIQTTAYICNGTGGAGSSAAPTGKLNDTGITLCGDYASGGSGFHQNNLDCSDAGATTSSTGIDVNGDPVPPGQDAHFGRDARAMDGSLTKIGAGSAGFDFTKIDATGDEMPDQASFWSCVRDNVTGLIWEVKTTNGGLQDTNNTYSWYSQDSSNNGEGPTGFYAGTIDGGTCSGGTGCDTEKYVADINTMGLCGHSDWRLPTLDELVSIVDYGKLNPRIDTDYFPNTSGSSHWTSSTLPFGSAFQVEFGNSNSSVSSNSKPNANRVRLVR